jgi:hypothetical protein
MYFDDTPEGRYSRDHFGLDAAGDARPPATLAAARAQKAKSDAIKARARRLARR